MDKGVFIGRQLVYPGSTMVIHQLVPNFVPGDATGQSALHFRLLLRRLGHAGELYSAEVHPSLKHLVSPAKALAPGPDEWVFYHHGIASSLSSQLMHLPCRKGLIFHNISPEATYRGTPLHEALVSGRAQLAAMAPFVELAMGVSEFNCNELREAGHSNVHRVPLFIQPSRMAAPFADKALSKKLSAMGPYVLSVSRVVPHKRFEDVLAFFRELRRIRPDMHLVIAGGFSAGEPYFRALSKQAREVGGVTFLGRVSNEELIAAYQHASLFLSMSEHEGFGVPFLEAFAAQVPVMAFAAAAVPETLGGRGVAFTEKRFAALAEVARDILETPSMQKAIVRGQKQRLRELSAEAAERALKKALDTVQPKVPPKLRRKAQKPRVGFVVQRFGADLTGGAEAHARQVALRLSKHWDISVITTCAKDHLTWANVFPKGECRDKGLRVIRFPTTVERGMSSFNAHSRKVFGRPLDFLSEENWVAHQGPWAPGLLQHLSLEKENYDGFVFFTYLYAPTVWGLPLVAEKALLVPTAHDEAPFYFDTYLDVFEKPRALLCNTEEEWALIHKRAPQAAPGHVVGVGIETPLNMSPARFRKKYQLNADYLLYVGRVEEGKGVGELIQIHQRLSNAPTLVLAGAASMTVKGKNIRYLGRISEQDKFDGLKGALATVVPSRYESLSLLTLESFAVGTPVLGQAACDVVKGHIERSQAGRAYSSAKDFSDALAHVRQGRDLLGKRGLQYSRHYTWDKVVKTYLLQMKQLMKDAP